MVHNSTAVDMSPENPPECEFCGTVVFVGMNGSLRKVKMNDGTRKESWLCHGCDPDE